MAKRVIRVAVDARPLSWGVARGIRRVVSNLVDNMADYVSDELEIVLFSNEPLVRNVTGMPFQLLEGSQPSFAFRKLGNAMKDQEFDVLLATSPAVGRMPCPVVLIVHDVYDLFSSQYLSFKNRACLSYFMSQVAVRAKLLTAKHAEAIIVPSERTRADIIKARPSIADKQFSTVAWGTDKSLGLTDLESRSRIVQDELGIVKPYILYVGAVNEQKNIDGLLSIYREVRSQIGDLELVIVGVKTWPECGISAIDEIEGVRYWKYLEDRSLSALYGSCRALLLISWYEGFGLTVVEGMACGAPVIASNRGSLPELFSGSALLFDPSDVKGIANAVERLCRDTELHDEMVKKGLIKSASFSWENAAKRTMEVLMGVAVRDGGV